MIAPAHPTPAARVRGLTVRVDGTRRAVLSDVSLDVRAGESVALVGPNGGGKSTLLRAILGLAEASAGTVNVAGLTPRKAAAAGDVVGYLPQRPEVPALLPVTPRQAVRLAVTGRWWFRRAKPADVGFAWELWKQLAGNDWPEVADVPLGRLSGGRVQQVYVARALANRPRLVLLDEPTVGLDAPAVVRLVKVLHAARDAGAAILTATHDHPTATRVASRLVYVDSTVRYEGRTDRVPPDLDARLCHHAPGVAGCGVGCGAGVYAETAGLTATT